LVHIIPEFLTNSHNKSRPYFIQFHLIFIDFIKLKILLEVLWFNWSDIKNPNAGGAEVFTHEVMRRLAIKGHNMTLFSAEIPKGLQNEQVDGVNIIRQGSKYSVYRKAKEYYQRHEKNFDYIIDEINTKPFLTPKFVKQKPILALIHQLAREFWLYETHFPINLIGYYYLERKWLSYYKDILTATVSNSSKQDLEKIGFRKILLVPQGLSAIPLSEVANKEPNPTVAFIGRLKKAKLPHHALEAFRLIKKEIPNAKMWIIGDGYMLDQLRNSKIVDVIFYGHVSNKLKFHMLSKAHIVLVPAVREGWSLVVTESNAMGTPIIAYNVPGLRDSVRHGETGILVKDNSPESLAHAAVSLLHDSVLLRKYSENALAFSRQFDWDNTADVFDKVINTN
jgi:glycosyltransferase involved in cell wall biosynthesis